jgi:hypothetical protein
MDTPVKVMHVFAHDPSEFEREVNEALRRIFESNAVVGDIKYSIDPTTASARGGFGALIIYEMEGPES